MTRRLDGPLCDALRGNQINVRPSWDQPDAPLCILHQAQIQAGNVCEGVYKVAQGIFVTSLDPKKFRITRIQPYQWTNQSGEVNSRSRSGIQWPWDVDGPGHVQIQLLFRECPTQEQASGFIQRTPGRIISRSEH